MLRSTFKLQKKFIAKILNAPVLIFFIEKLENKTLLHWQADLRHTSGRMKFSRWIWNWWMLEDYPGSTEKKKETEKDANTFHNRPGPATPSTALGTACLSWEPLHRQQHCRGQEFKDRGMLSEKLKNPVSWAFCIKIHLATCKALISTLWSIFFSSLLQKV